MDRLNLRYTRDDAPNGSGDMEIAVQAGGFAGRTRSYVAESQLAEFASRMDAYPLSEPNVSLRALDLDIVVTRHGELGHLKISIDLRDGRSEVVQRATLQFVSDYAALSTFKDELSHVLSQAGGSATLMGNR